MGENKSLTGTWDWDPPIKTPIHRQGTFAVTGRAHCQRQVAFFSKNVLQFLFRGMPNILLLTGPSTSREAQEAHIDVIHDFSQKSTPPKATKW